jgi:hypothetical protein
MRSLTGNSLKANGVINLSSTALSCPGYMRPNLDVTRHRSTTSVSVIGLLHICSIEYGTSGGEVS